MIDKTMLKTLYLHLMALRSCGFIGTLSFPWPYTVMLTQSSAVTRYSSRFKASLLEVELWLTHFTNFSLCIMIPNLASPRETKPTEKINKYHVKCISSLLGLICTLHIEFINTSAFII